MRVKVLLDLLFFWCHPSRYSAEDVVEHTIQHLSGWPLRRMSDRLNAKVELETNVIFREELGSTNDKAEGGGEDNCVQ